MSAPDHSTGLRRARRGAWQPLKKWLLLAQSGHSLSKFYGNSLMPNVPLALDLGYRCGNLMQLGVGQSTEWRCLGIPHCEMRSGKRGLSPKNSTCFQASAVGVEVCSAAPGIVGERRLWDIDDIVSLIEKWEATDQ